jgi:hypothetical protein
VREERLPPSLDDVLEEEEKENEADPIQAWKQQQQQQQQRESLEQQGAESADY